jgi:hypothetical protein
MAEVFNDTFAASNNTELKNHTPTSVGTGWTERVNDSTRRLSILANAVSASGFSSGSTILYTADYTSVGAEIDVAMRIVSLYGGSDGPVYLIARYQDANNFYGLRITREATEKAKIFKVVSGTATVLATTSTTPSNGDTLKLEVIGSTLKAYINGSEVASVIDSSITAAGPGGLGWGNIALDSSVDDVNGNNTVDDFVVNETAGAESFSIAGNASLDLTSSSSMNVRRSFTGSGSLGISANSTMKVGRSLNGSASLGTTAFSGMSVSRAWIGSGTLGHSSASVMSFGGVESIFGSAILSLTGDAQLSVGIVLVGSSSVSLLSSSAMSARRVVSGGATFDLNSNSQMSVGRSIIGSSGLRIASNSALNFIANKSIIGSANIGLAPNTAMSVHRTLIGSVTFEISSTSVFGFASNQLVKLAALSISDAALNEIMITETLAVNCTLKEKLANKITITEEVL